VHTECPHCDQHDDGRSWPNAEVQLLASESALSVNPLKVGAGGTEFDSAEETAIKAGPLRVAA
jgi:hypothetical protein